VIILKIRKRDEQEEFLVLPKMVIINGAMILSYFALRNAYLIHQNGDTKQAIQIAALIIISMVIIIFDIYKT
jgi:hydrogenase-4 membrane subunit HyfE